MGYPVNDYRSYLQHSGVKGMKWYERRYQNPDGSYTELGKMRRRKSVFISGSSKTQDETSTHYRKSLPVEVQRQISQYIKEGKHINIGDAPGIDRQVQDFLKTKGYKDVTVYSPGKEVRYKSDSNWESKLVNNPKHKEGSPEWLADKDKAMEQDSDEGLAIVIDTGARATRNNVSRLIANNKNVKVYELSSLTKNLDHWLSKDAISNIQIPKTETDLLKEYDMAIELLYRKQRSLYNKATKGLNKHEDYDTFYKAYKNAVNSDAWHEIQEDITKINRMKKASKVGGI